MVVAEGTVYPSGDLIHGVRSRPDHYKVSVDTPYPEHDHCKLPCDCQDGETTTVREAVGHFLEWPVSLVHIIGQEEVKYFMFGSIYFILLLDLFKLEFSPL